MLQKRLDYGFNGYQVPPTPRAPRSARRRSPTIRKKTEDVQMCAFDLLATVAGKILLEGDVSPPDAAALRNNDIGPAVDGQENGTEEKNEGFQSMKLKVGVDQVNSGISLAVQEIVSPAGDPLCKDMPNTQGVTSPAVVSVVTNSASDGSRKIDFEDKMVLESDKSEIGCHSSKLSDSGKSNIVCHSNKLGGRYASSYRGGSCVVPKLEDCTKPLMSSGPVNMDRVLFGTRPHVCDSENLKSFSNNNKPLTLVSSYSNSNGKVASFCKENCSISPTRDSVKVVSRDDDENSSKCSRPSMKTKKHVPPPRFGNRRIRKLLASRHWKVALKTKDGDLSDNGGEFQFVYRSRNNGHKRQRSQRIYPLKKRKLFHCLSNTDEGITCDGIYKSTERETMDMTTSDLGAIWHGAVGKSPSPGEQDHASVQSRESHVKLRIKSFRVPELFIELPETATVGSLKKTVMDAVTALLGGGLRVGVLLQGKKIRDDGKTLLQSGILHDDEAEAVGFSLEPNISEDHGLVIFNEERQLLLRSLPAASMGVHQGTSHATLDYQGTNLSNNFIESDHDSAPSPAENSSAEKSGADSRALVAVPDGNAEALAAIPPMNQKCKRSDMSQRRIRRPFSVSEVEALVRAVERLGTGRWRDVKLRAFDNVKHRTYVDLKDKWKTLVHTARISPQQRRGEPVPQELLDRVLIAHGYWSQQQAKHQQLKQQNEAACLIA